LVSKADNSVMMSDAAMTIGVPVSLPRRRYRRYQAIARGIARDSRYRFVFTIGSNS
jgi:hypothetical protein